MRYHVPNPGSLISVLRAAPKNLLRWGPLLPVAAVCAALLWHHRHYWPTQTNYILGDTRQYLAIAEALRHGKAHYMLGLFPPGYPLAIAALPWPISLTTATVISAIAFLGLIIATYALALRLTNPVGASIASATWLLWFARWTQWPTCQMSDSLFALVLLGTLLAIHPAAKGVLAGYAALVRPEGMVLAALISLSQKRLRAIFVCAGIAGIVYLPYVTALHGLTGKWELTGKATFNRSFAPYWVGGCSATERGKMFTAYGEWQVLPSPRDPAVRAILGPVRRAYVRQMEPLDARLHYNAGLWFRWIHGTWPLYPIALLGAAVALWRRRFALVRLGLIPLALSLTWLPFFMAGDRLMFPAFAGLAIWASGVTLIASSLKSYRNPSLHTHWPVPDKQRS